MTYQKPALSFAQVQASMEAMVEKAEQLPNPVAIAVVDDAGNLKAYIAMDNVRLFARRHALRKAYTAAIVGMDSGVHAEQLKKSGRSLSDLGGSVTLGPGRLRSRSFWPRCVKAPWIWILSAVKSCKVWRKKSSISRRALSTS
jgi:hypothetical protein